MICKIIIHVYSYLIIWSSVSQKNKKLYDLLNTPYGHIIENIRVQDNQQVHFSAIVLSMLGGTEGG